jgi:hypothetical protein
VSTQRFTFPGIPPTWSTQIVQNFLDSPSYLQSLLMDEAKTWQQEQHVLTSSFHRTWSQVKLGNA